MATERQSPDGLLTQTNLSGILSTIQDDPDSPDGNWLTYITNNVDTVCRVSFPTPTGNPTVGADLQQFKIWVRKQPGTGTPTVRIEIYEDGVSKATILANTNVTSTTGALYSGTWNANLLGTANGSLVECYIYGTAVGGAPAGRCTVEVGAVEWNVTYTIPLVTFAGIADIALGTTLSKFNRSIKYTITADIVTNSVLSFLSRLRKFVSNMGITVSTVLTKFNRIIKIVGQADMVTTTEASFSTFAAAVYVYFVGVAHIITTAILNKISRIRKFAGQVNIAISINAILKRLRGFISNINIEINTTLSSFKYIRFFKSVANIITDSVVSKISILRSFKSNIPITVSAIINKISVVKVFASSISIFIGTISRIRYLGWHKLRKITTDWTDGNKTTTDWTDGNKTTTDWDDD